MLRVDGLVQPRAYHRVQGLEEPVPQAVGDGVGNALVQAPLHQRGEVHADVDAEVPDRDGLGQEAPRRIGLQAEVVAEAEVRGSVVAQMPEHGCHVHGRGGRGRGGQLLDEGVDLPHHVGLERAHRLLGENLADYSPLSAVQCPVDDGEYVEYARSVLGRPIDVGLDELVTLVNVCDT